MPFEPNWNDLPDKVKHKCIGKMDFETRLKLRSTSRSDRRLVNIHQTHLKLVEIHEKDGFPIGSITIIPEKGKSIHVQCDDQDSNHHTMIPFVKFVMKTGKIGKLDVNVYKDEELKEELIKIALKFPKKPKEFNWNDLSEKLKARVINKMDFKTRLRFRKTARYERTLVDSQLVNFNYIQLTGNSQKINNFCTELSFQTTATNQECIFKFRETSEFIRKILPLLVYILEIGVIDMFLTHFTMEFIDILIEKITKLHGFPKLRIKTLDYLVSRKAMFWFLRNCDERYLEYIETGAQNYRQFPIDRFLTFPIKWLKIDAKLGTTLILHAPGNLDEFIEKFENRIDFQSPRGDLWLSMNDPEKQIYIKVDNLDDFNCLDSCRCEVVPPCWDFINFFFMF
ncbi:hypothetical protein GCK72_013247 [Caenorhabditis remanei]|uniref:F-box domain-containing protein n=1 Tax=Caenorhabditis remanei TaxID=31234 RepID=A0A6A5GQB9_CAERE|nr:hypothetical protein GCK72_013247 [Caenorhabditis remanei]KAF1756793.1 hypothetical protein GCK72_013247 [Caenorhabditis remanei]